MGSPFPSARSTLARASVIPRMRKGLCTRKSGCRNARASSGSLSRAARAPGRAPRSRPSSSASSPHVGEGAPARCAKSLGRSRVHHAASVPHRARRMRAGRARREQARQEPDETGSLSGSAAPAPVAPSASAVSASSGAAPTMVTAVCSPALRPAPRRWWRPSRARR